MFERKCIVLVLYGAFLVSGIIEAAPEKKKTKLSAGSSTNAETIYCTFKAKDFDSTKMVKYHIQNLPESRFEEATEFLFNFYVKEDPYYGSRMNSQFMEVSKTAIMYNLRKNLSVVCVKSKSDEMVGVNVLRLFAKNDRIIMSPTKVMRIEHNVAPWQIFNENMAQLHNFDVFTKYNVSQYLGSDGLAVQPGYRGRGIGEKLLRCREEICKKLDIKVSSSVFTTDSSNRLAEKVGFKIDKSFRYVVMEKRLLFV